MNYLRRYLDLVLIISNEKTVKLKSEKLNSQCITIITVVLLLILQYYKIKS